MSSYPTSNQQPPHPGNLILVGLILTGVSVGVVAFNRKWIESVWQGPTALSAAELRKLQNPAALRNQWVTITFDKMIDTGLQVVVTNRGNAVKSRYVLIQVGGNW